MNITRDNYESWFLDYLEGNLDEKQMEEFIRFIHENPDLKEELRLYIPISLDKEEYTYQGKEKLYKESFDIPEIFDETAVAMLEGDLDEASAGPFSNYLLNHPEKKRDMELFRQTRLKPDESLKFHDRNKLYRQSVLILYTRQLMRIAALLVLALILFPLTVKQPPHSDRAEVNTVSSPDPGLQKQEAVTTAENNIPEASAMEKPGPEKKKPNRPAGNQMKMETVSPTPSTDLAATSAPVRHDFPELLASAEPLEMVLLPQNKPEIFTPLIQEEYYAYAEPSVIPLTGKIAEKIGFPEISLRKIARWGLDLISDLSKEKFSYTTNTEGEITAYTLDTRLLGLSIPAGN